MNVKLRRLLMPLLRHDAAGKPPTFRTRSAARQAIYLIEKPVSSKSKSGRLRREQQRATHKEETAKIREEVMGRSDGKCENCFKTDLHLQLDHWLGGCGRRREQQSVETTWALCAPCHLARTEHVPSAGYWNDRFERHAYKHGYPFQAHIIHAEPAKAGGAP